MTGQFDAVVIGGGMSGPPLAPRAMVIGATYSDIGAMIHVHPTLAESINSATGGVHRPSSE